MGDIEESQQAGAVVWKYALGFNTMRVLKCAIELGIADILERHGDNPMTLSDLSSAIGCSHSSLQRIMRYLMHQGIFKIIKTKPTIDNETSKASAISYAQTPLSRSLLMKDGLAPFVLMHSYPAKPWSGIEADVLKTGGTSAFEAAHGEDMWTKRSHRDERAIELLTESMESHSRMSTRAIIDNYPEAFRGVESVVDVGGRHGLALSRLVKAFPWIRSGINFDLPHVVSQAPPRDGIQHVGGTMFEIIPEADAVMLMWILHDWSDEACIEILKKCKEAIPMEKGKVIIVEAVIFEVEDEEDEYEGARLSLDITMMATTVKGRERTCEEWAHLLNAAGFSKHKVTKIQAIDSVIEAYP